MRDVCPKCGAQLREGAAFCPQCGASIQLRPEPSKNVSGTKSKRNLVIIGIVVVVIVVALGIFCGVKACNGGTHGAEKVIEKYANSYTEGNYEDFTSCFSDAYAAKYFSDVDEDEAASDFEENAESREGLSFKILDSKTADADFVESINDLYQEWYDTDDKVSEAVFVKVKTVQEDEDGEEETDREWVTVIKVNGKWYLDMSETEEEYFDD